MTQAMEHGFSTLSCRYVSTAPFKPLRGFRDGRDRRFVTTTWAASYFGDAPRTKVASSGAIARNPGRSARDATCNDTVGQSSVSPSTDGQGPEPPGDREFGTAIEAARMAGSLSDMSDLRAVPGIGRAGKAVMRIGTMETQNMTPDNQITGRTASDDGRGMRVMQISWNGPWSLARQRSMASPNLRACSARHAGRAHDCFVRPSL
jgi:hypothetical protein